MRLINWPQWFRLPAAGRITGNPQLFAQYSNGITIPPCRAQTVNKPILNLAAHFSIVWGITLAVVTTLEWYNLERKPLDHEILSPFFERRVQVSIERQLPQATADIPEFSEMAEPDAALRYDVSLDFNGPLFLVCFFTPVLIFHGAAALWRRLRSH